MLNRLGWFSFSSRAVGKLTGGAAIVQLVTIGAAPVLTRLYSPSELGVFALFLALVGTLAFLGTGGYGNAVVSTHSNRNSLELVGFTVRISALFSVFLLVAIFAAVPIGWLSQDHLSLGLWLPLATFFAGFNIVVVSYANRTQKYGLISSSRMLQTTAASLTHIILGFLFPSPQALIGGSVGGTLFANVWLTRNWVRDAKLSGVSLFGTFSAARMNAKFPVFTLPAGIVSQVRLAGLPIAIAAIFGPATLGLWSIAQRVLGLPLGLLGDAVGAVYYRRAVLVSDSKVASMKLYRKAMVGLVLLSLIPFLGLMLWAPEIFQFVFGTEWKTAGLYAQLMIPWLWLRFLVNPVSRVVLVYERNRLGLGLQGMLTVLAAGVTLVAWTLNWDFLDFLFMFSWVMAVGYAFLLIVYPLVIRRGVIHRFSEQDSIGK